MISNSRKFYLLNGQQKKLFIEAYFTLGFFRAAIMARSFKSLVSELNQNEDSAGIELTDEKKQLALLIGKEITAAANHTPWESTCLVQTLTAKRMLGKRNIAGKFHLGVKMNSAESDPLAAHAWLICGGTILTGESGHESYTVISTFSWK